MSISLSDKKNSVEPTARKGWSNYSTLMQVVNEGRRSLSLVGVLLVVGVVFNILTDGLFFTSRNLTFLSIQVAITAILACGIVMVMVAGHIDLSTGSAAAVTGIMSAVIAQDLSESLVVIVVLTVVIGAIIGAWHAFWIAVLRVPAFIVTLASLLALRGVSLLITEGESIRAGQGLIDIVNAYVPPLPTALIFAALLILIVWLRYADWKALRVAGLPSPMWSGFGLPAAVTVVGIAVIVAIFVPYRGLPVPVLVLVVVALAISLVLRYTKRGRHIYAIGGNEDAAFLSGVKIKGTTALIFISMGVLYALAGLILVGRLGAATPNAASGLELSVIAAAVIGGTSLFGGVGTIIGAITGAVLMESLNSGMSLLNLPSYWQQITAGLVLLVAVYLDIRGRRQGTGR